jgi:exosortase
LLLVLKMTMTPVLARERPRVHAPGIWLETALIAALIVLLYSEIIPDLVSDWWTQPALSYGLLIPPLALYIANLRRDITLAIPAETNWSGCWLVAFACLVFLAGSLSAEFFLSRISLVLLLAGLVWTFWGMARLRTLAFPFLLLATMVPLPQLVYNALSAPLQLFASSLATDLAQVLGVTVYRDGNIIHLAHVSLGVAEACSGLSSLSAMVVASLLLGFLAAASVAGRILLLVLSVPLAIAVNVVRVTGTAVLADYQTEFALGFYHAFSGWLVFLVGLAALWALSKILFRVVR